MSIKIRGELFFKTWMGCGNDTNRREDVLALWGFLYFAQKKGICFIFMCIEIQTYLMIG